MIDPNKMREALVQHVLKSVLPPFFTQPSSIRVTVPPNAISVVEDDKLGVTTLTKSVICVHAERTKKLIEKLTKIKDEAIFVKIGHWTSFHGLDVEEHQIYIVKTFHDLFKLYDDLATGRLKAKYLVVGGLLNVHEEDKPEYIYVLYSTLSFVEFLVFVVAGPLEETRRMEKYCEEVVTA